MRSRWLLPAALLLALGLGAPARAAVTTISTPTDGPFTVNTGDELDIITGGSVTVVSGTAVIVNGGTLNMSDGSVSSTGASGRAVEVKAGTADISGGMVSGLFAVEVEGGTANISGGTVAGGSTGVEVEGGAATISGGTVSGTGIGGLYVAGGMATLSGGSVSGGLAVTAGTLTVVGCNLAVAGFILTGTLADGTPINTSVTVEPGPALVLQNSCPGGDLSVGITAGTNKVRSGTDLTYTILARNNGPLIAGGVIINDPVPGGSVFVSAARNSNAGTLITPPVGGGGVVSWSVGDLTSGQSVTLTVVVRVTQKGNSTISNTASVTSSTADPNPANNSATVQSKVIGNSH